MASRALPDLIARIRVDSTGVDGAMQNLIGSFGRANLALAGLAAGIGILVVGGKSMIDIAEKHDAAMLGLAQAYAATGTNLTAYQRQIDDFIMSNRRFTGDQSAVIDGFAKLTRSGLTQNEVQKDMNRALDLAALKHITLEEAVTLLDAAEHGRLRGLIDLGITTSKYTDAQGNMVASSHNVATAMAEVDAKTKGGRDTITSLQQHSNELNHDWQNLSIKGGPVLLTLLDAIVTGVTHVYDWFDKVGKDNKLWSQISDRLVNMAKWIHDYLIKPMQDFFAMMNSGFNTPAGQAAPHLPNRASGGPVLPGGMYTVGENGPETLVMGSNGGMVIPSGGTTHYNLTLNGSSAVNDPDGVRRMLNRMQLLGAAG